MGTVANYVSNFISIRQPRTDIPQQLGDLLGKGAFGQVYSTSTIPFLPDCIDVCTVFTGALNWTTGETVAVKQIQLASIPKADLSEIMASLGRLSGAAYAANALNAYSFCAD